MMHHGTPCYTASGPSLDLGLPRGALSPVKHRFGNIFLSLSHAVTPRNNSARNFWRGVFCKVSADFLRMGSNFKKHMKTTTYRPFVNFLRFLRFLR